MNATTSTHGAARIVPEPEPPETLDGIMLVYLENHRRDLLRNLATVERAIEKLKALQGKKN